MVKIKDARKYAGTFAKHVVPGVVRPLHVLWNQIIGFFFVVLAGMTVPSAVREIQDPAARPRLILTVPFILVMAGFGIHSFLKARRLSKLL